ncbi:MAG: hypothetical protein P1U68_14025 [Verrucomicrobiales bacterium]|nr:hypothetical protein [Verrucomicrobiales bacterium]
MKSILTSLIICAFANSQLTAGEALFADPFTKDAPVSERRAVRGDWQIENGIASVTQDDALYKEYKDHGPIIFYALPTTDATFHYAVKPEGCKAIVFTLNGEDGHIFRFVSSAAGTNFRAFPPNGKTKSITAAKKAEWVLPENEWTAVKIAVTGSSATITMGEHEPVTVEHESYDREKTNFSIGFSFGSLAVKEVRVTAD